MLLMKISTLSMNFNWYDDVEENLFNEVLKYLSLGAFSTI